MIKFRVITVTNNLEAYPQHREDSEEFPYLVDYLVEDQVEHFIVDGDGGYWAARDFFDCNSITHFIVDSSERPA